MCHQPDKGLNLERDLRIPNEIGRENWRSCAEYSREFLKTLVIDLYIEASSMIIKVLEISNGTYKWMMVPFG